MKPFATLLSAAVFLILVSLMVQYSRNSLGRVETVNSSSEALPFNLSEQRTAHRRRHYRPRPVPVEAFRTDQEKSIPLSRRTASPATPVAVPGATVSAKSPVQRNPLIDPRDISEVGAVIGQMPPYVIEASFRYPQYTAPHSRTCTTVSVRGGFTCSFSRNRSVALLRTSHSTLREIENITVSWDGWRVGGPRVHVGDLVVLLAPPDRPVPWATVNITHTIMAARFVTVEVLNFRQPVVFRIVRVRDVIAESEVVCPQGYAPLHGRLARTRFPQSMSVTWQSGLGVESRVEFGVSEDALTMCSASTFTTYGARGFCRKAHIALAFSYFTPPGYIHTAFLTELSPDTVYYYRYGTPAVEGGWSAVFHFRTPPLDTPRVTFITYGDLGTRDWEGYTSSFPQWWTCKGSLLTTERVSSEVHSSVRDAKPDFILHLGDIAYSIGYALRWEMFFHQIQRIAHFVPYMTLDGNHDTQRSDSYGECGVPIRAMFNMPNKPFKYYSFDQGSIHFCILSTEGEHDHFTLYSKASKQLEWLQKDLERVNKTATPFIVLAGHRPLFTSEKSKARLVTSHWQRQLLLPIIEKYGVALSLWGHVHSYERSCFLAGRACTKVNGHVSVVVGTGGKDLSPNIDPDPPPWAGKRLSHFGFLRVTADSYRLQCRFVRAVDGEEVDKFTIFRNMTFADEN